MMEIAADTSGNGVLQKDIAKNQELSNKYLDHIISGLKAARLIANVRGKKSGYKITRDPSEITMYDIHNAFEDGICVIDCINLDSKCDKLDSCKSQVFWKGLNKVVLDYFQNTTLLDIMETKVKNAEML